MREPERHRRNMFRGDEAECERITGSLTRSTATETHYETG